jgi:hypothetical protein
MLEGTALVHQPAGGEPTPVQDRMALYRDQVDVADDLDFTQGSDRTGNTPKPPAEVAKQALMRTKPLVYALMVFDCALLRLGGLS